jgi:dynein heavy chain
LSSTDEFRHLDRDIESSSKRWRKIIESEFPERERLPQDWKTRSALQRLCVLRALRPDRLSHALRLFIEEKLGSRYVESLTVELSQCVAEMSPTTPLCFILSTGVNPLLEVEQIARKMGRTADNGLLHLVSLGQGQEGNAENVLKKSSEYGHWVILQVIIYPNSFYNRCVLMACACFHIHRISI